MAPGTLNQGVAAALGDTKPPVPARRGCRALVPGARAR